MIIDFHTHTYPKHLTERIISTLSAESGVTAHTDATADGLIQSCIDQNIDKCVVLPVSTNPKQTEKLNRIVFETNEANSRLISFGAIHPDNTDYKEIISSLHSNGVKGIKLHPVFQNTSADDIKYKRILYNACEHGLIISIHAGLDISNPTSDASSVASIRNLLLEVKPDKMVLAHMGGHFGWDAAEDMIIEYMAETAGKCSLYLDTALCLNHSNTSKNIRHTFLSNEQFLKLVYLMGSDKILFGTDSPWGDQGLSIEAIMHSGLREEEISRILYENARDLLSL